MNKNSKKILYVVIFLLVLSLISIIASNKDNLNNSESLNILSSYDNADLEDNIKNYVKKNNIKVKFTYMGDLDIIDEINNYSSNYDCVWIANSMWLYMLDNPYLVSESKSISISPVVFGVKKSKVSELNLKNGNISNSDILNLIKENKLKYIMPSVTKTNTGATAYMGFLNAIAGNPEVLTEKHLENANLIKDLTDLFKGVERVSGDETFLKEMFLNNDEYEAVIADEASLININTMLKNKKKEELYLIYPIDGVAINDSAFAFIDNKKNKKETFLKLQTYLLSDKFQETLKEKGRRTWYGGTNDKVNEKVFNPDWGIDTKKYLNVTKFPSKKVMTEAINLYIETLRKPTHTVFCLDYSGSMNDILNYNEASTDKLQFSKNDKITIILFSSKINGIYNTMSGYETGNLIKEIENGYVGGGTALYKAIIEGLNILNQENDNYNKTIIAMTDGIINIGNYNELSSYYKKINKEIPVYSITFGSASEKELKRIAKLTNAKVFDGKTSLLNAFKEVRGYN